jgi:hypothetical protein
LDHLDHPLDDSGARADMLRKSDAFLRQLSACESPAGRSRDSPGFAGARPLCYINRMNDLAISIAVNVVLGVALLAILRWKQPGDTVRLDGASEAIEIFAQRFPVAGEATLAHDGRSALIDLDSAGCVGLLQRHGRRWNARTLGRGEVASAELVEATVIKLTFADFGWPHAQIRIDDADTREAWLRRLQALRSRHA